MPQSWDIVKTPGVGCGYDIHVKNEDKPWVLPNTEGGRAARAALETARRGGAATDEFEYLLIRKFFINGVATFYSPSSVIVTAMDSCGVTANEWRRCTTKWWSSSKCVNTWRGFALAPDNFRDVVFEDWPRTGPLPIHETRFRRRRQARDRQSQQVRRAVRRRGGLRRRRTAVSSTRSTPSSPPATPRLPRHRRHSTTTHSTLSLYSHAVSSSSSTRARAVSPSRRLENALGELRSFQTIPRLRTPPRVDGRSLAPAVHRPRRRLLPHRRRSRYCRRPSSSATTRRSSRTRPRCLSPIPEQRPSARARVARRGETRPTRGEIGHGRARSAEPSRSSTGRGELRAERADARFDRFGLTKYGAHRGDRTWRIDGARFWTQGRMRSWWRCTMDTVATR